jgi:hypothetical protein
MTKLIDRPDAHHPMVDGHGAKAKPTAISGGEENLRLPKGPPVAGVPIRR